MDFFRYVVQYFRPPSTSTEALTQMPGNLMPVWSNTGQLIGYQAGNPPISSHTRPPSGPTVQPPTLPENRPSEIHPNRSPTASEFPIDLKQRPRPDNWDGWPNGTWSHVFTWEEYIMTGRLRSHWSFKGGTSKKGLRNALAHSAGYRTKRSCRGVFVCSDEDCDFLARPPVDAKRVDNHKVKVYCELCHQPMKLLSCHAYEWLTRYIGGCLYQHFGTHEHPRPPIKSALPWEEDDFEEYVLAHPEATPAQLRVGVSTPLGRKPAVSAISPAYLNNDRVAVQRKNILRQYKQPSGGDSFLHQLQQFHSKYPNYLLHDSITTLPKTVISVQTPWMREQSVRDSSLEGPLNGMVTDGAHGFWRDRAAVLQVSSVYSIPLDRWIPVIMSYMNGHSAQEFKIHFLNLFRGIAEVVTSRGGDDLDQHLPTVMDFSQAQREGFILAYVELYTSVPGDWGGVRRDESALRQSAEALLKGCAEHFRQAVSRVGVKHAVVEPERHDEFMAHAMQMSRVSSYDDYERLARGLINDFPRITKFLTWWMRPSRAMMIMKSHRVMEEDLWHSLPDTTNAQEAGHWATYRAAGIDHDVLGGLEALHAVVQSFQTQDAGARRGQKSHYGHERRERRMDNEHGRTHPRRDPLVNRGAKYVNDGRAPDTAAKLVGKKSLQKHRREAANSLNETFGSIYFKWKQNSCWLDVSLVLLDNSLARRWDEFQQVSSPILDKNGIGVIVAAMQRIRGLKASPEQNSGLADSLAVQRDVIRDALYGDRIIMEKGAFEMVFAWLPAFIRRSYAFARIEDEGKFIPYLLPLYLEIHECSGSWHTEGRHLEISPRLQPLFTLQLGAPEHEACGGRLSRWFFDFLTPKPTTGLRCWRIADDVGLLCSGTRQDHRRYIASLPVILIIEFVQDNLEDPLHWCIPSSLVTQYSALTRGRSLGYDLVGISLISDRHFTARYFNPDEKAVYLYDDRAHNGRAKRKPDGALRGDLGGYPFVPPPKHAVHYAVYALKGGLDAQQVFYDVRAAELKKDFDIIVTPLSNSPDVQYRGKLSLMVAQRRTWIKSKSNRYNYYEYVDPTLADSMVDLRAATPLTPESEETTYGTKVTPGINPTNNDIVNLYNLVHTPDDDDHDSLPAYPFPVKAEKKVTPQQEGPKQIEDYDDKDLDVSKDQGRGEPRFDCRCGVTGPPALVYSVAPREGKIFGCSDCKRLSHVACQPHGINTPAKKPKCYHCSGPIATDVEVTDRRMLSNVWLVNRTLRERLRPGIGALCKLGDFFYPVRLLEYDPKSHNWEVQWWRGCRFVDGEQSRLPGGVTFEPEANVTDANWGHTMARRNIRLGVWNLATNLKEDVSDSDVDPNYTSYIPAINQALLPHLSTLRDLLLAPDSLNDSNIPILQHTRGLNYGHPKYDKQVKVRGAILSIDRAGITNWLHQHLGADASLDAERLMGRTMCHACTLWIADMLWKAGGTKSGDMDWIQEAWRIQNETSRLVGRVDVNKESIRQLERLMFEFGDDAGKAGDFMWGLNLGDHQDHWQPYNFIPKDWIQNTHQVDKLNNLIGWDYIQVLTPSMSPHTTQTDVTMVGVTETASGNANGNSTPSRKRQRSLEADEEVKPSTRGRGQRGSASTKARGRGAPRGRGSRGRGRAGAKIPRE